MRDSRHSLWVTAARLTPLLCAALAGLTITAIAYRVTVQWVHYRVHSRFERAALDHSASVRRSLSDAFDALDGMHDFYRASAVVEHDEFDRFARGKRQRVAGVRALFWAPLVDSDTRAVTIAEVRRYDPGFDIEDGDTVDDDAELFPVIYLYPDRASMIRRGIDLSFHPVIGSLLARARESDQAVLSPGIIPAKARPGTDGAIVVLLKAVYDDEAPIPDGRWRRRILQGVVGMELSIGTLITRALTHLQIKGIDLELADLTDGTPPQVLYIHASRVRNGRVANPTHRTQQPLVFEETFEVGQRLWRIRETAVPDHFEWRLQTWEPNAVLGTGLLLTVMLVGYLSFVQEKTARIQRIVRQRTEDLRRTNDTLTEEIAVRKTREAELETAKQQLEQQIRVRTQSLTEQLERIIREMAEREKAEQRLQLEKERAQVTLRSIADGVITTDATGRITAINPVAERLLGWSAADAFGRTIDEVYTVHDENGGGPVANPVAQALRDNQPVQRGDDVLFHRRDGKQFAFQNCASPIRSPGGELYGAVLVFSDNTRYHTLARELAYQAKHDSLTGVFNRRHFEACLEAALKSGRDGKRSVVLAYMDLDQFKIINDTCGHLAGDELLRQVALILPQSLRKADIFARLGGDEFGLLLIDCPMPEAQRLADELLEKIRTYRFVWGKRTFSITISIGLVLSTPQRQTTARMLSAADAACYLAKDHGRNRIHRFDDADNDIARRASEMEWVSRIQAAVEKGRFHLSGQRIDPIIPTPTSAPLVELLVCLEDDAEGMVPPATFIPAAERYNLMTDIDAWVVEQCLLRLDRIRLPSTPDRSPELFMINLSATSICNEPFLDRIRTLFEASSLPADRICFEITETAAVANFSRAVLFIRELKQLGFDAHQK